jgi:hypothetical protein
MDKKDFIRIINEEIKNFDFLGNEESAKEQEDIDLLQNEDLQKQFISDTLLNRKEKIKTLNIADGKMTGNWNEPNRDDADKLSLEYNITVQYKYDSVKEPLEFDLSFNGSNIGINISGSDDTGDYNTPPSNESWINSINWHEINVGLFTTDGDEIDFLAFKRAPQKIQDLFVREFLEDFISERANMDISQQADNNAIVQYT